MRISWVTTVAAFVLVSSLAAPAADKADPEEARKAIEAVNAAFSRAFAQGDASGLAGYYTEDAAVFPPGDEIVRGRKQIEEFWKGVMSGGAKAATLETKEVENLGDTAWETGTVELAVEPKDGEATVQKAKYVVVWKRQPDGAWKLHRDIWNELPAAKAAVTP